MNPFVRRQKNKNSVLRHGARWTSVFALFFAANLTQVRGLHRGCWPKCLPHVHSTWTQSTTMNPTKSERSNSPELPTQTHVPHSSFPTPALVDSVAAGAHYSGGLGPRSVSQTSGSDGVHEHTRRRSKHTLEDEAMRESVREPLPDHMQVLDDLEELYACRPTVEIFKRSWNKDGIFEVLVPISLTNSLGSDHSTFRTHWPRQLDILNMLRSGSRCRSCSPNRNRFRAE
jgi:hypothetical protein